MTTVPLPFFSLSAPQSLQCSTQTFIWEMKQLCSLLWHHYHTTRCLLFSASQVPRPDWQQLLPTRLPIRPSYVSFDLASLSSTLHLERRENSFYGLPRPSGERGHFPGWFADSVISPLSNSPDLNSWPFLFYLHVTFYTHWLFLHSPYANSFKPELRSLLLYKTNLDSLSQETGRRPFPWLI